MQLKMVFEWHVQALNNSSNAVRGINNEDTP